MVIGEQPEEGGRWANWREDLVLETFCYGGASLLPDSILGTKMPGAEAEGGATAPSGKRSSGFIQMEN